MQGRNHCFENTQELFQCLTALSHADRRMNLLNAHFAPGDLSALVEKDAHLYKDTLDRFTKILLQIPEKGQIVWLQQEAAWLKEKIRDTQQAAAVLSRFTPLAWPVLFGIMQPNLLNKPAFDAILALKPAQYRSDDKDNDVIKSIRESLPDLLTCQDLLTTVKALIGYGDSRISLLIKQFHPLIQTFDDFAQMFNILTYSRQRKELVTVLGKDWCAREVNTVDRVTMVLQTYAEDEALYPWLEAVIPPLVTDIEVFRKLHRAMYHATSFHQRDATIRNLLTALMPHLNTPDAVAQTLVELYPAEAPAKRFLAESIGRQLVQRNPSPAYAEVLQLMEIFNEYSSGVMLSYTDPYRSQESLVRYHDFYNLCFKAFFNGLKDYLRVWIKTEADLQQMEQRLPDDDELKNTLYKILDSHLSKIITDPARLRILRIQHNLPVESRWSSIWHGLTQPAAPSSDDGHAMSAGNAYQP